MARFELSEAADRDLTDIYRYSYRQFGADQADAYLFGLDECFARLTQFPDLGRSIDHLRRGYFRFEHRFLREVRGGHSRHPGAARADGSGAPPLAASSPQRD